MGTVQYSLVSSQRLTNCKIMLQRIIMVILFCLRAFYVILGFMKYMVIILMILIDIKLLFNCQPFLAEED